ncbi:MFS transporter [Sciscionella marina]|uniref:MFS transporter n=1 Tax=Sciscionella marina TaxID=508770 RepID=UPI000373852F|nr:MFS transporter [Sciscionella marina]
MRKVLLGALAGHTIEWYDFGLYGLLAVHMGERFFPSGDPVASNLSAFAVFGVAFVARPLGGAILGPIGDRLGRRTALVVSLVVMAFSTALVGVLPSYGAIGIWAPIVLVLVRLLSGMSAGGETPSAYAYVSEYAPARRRALFTSLLSGGSAVGALLGTLVVFVIQLSMPGDVFQSWGWRIPFLIALPLGAMGLYIRWRIEESPVFTELRAAGNVSRSPLRESLTRDWRMLLQAIGIAAVIFVSYFVLLSYLPSYLAGLGLTPRTVSTINIVTVVSTLVFFPLVGVLADVIGKKTVLVGAAIYLVVLSWPIFWLLSTANIALVLAGAALLAFGVSAVAGPGPVFVSELASIRTRVSSFALGYNLGGTVFGGPALYVSGFLVAATGDTRSPAYFIVVAAVISVIAILTTRARDAAPDGAEIRLPEDSEPVPRVAPDIPRFDS